MTTHTPGPWHVTGQSEQGRYITVKSATGRTVARVPFSAESDTSPTDDSDSRLIAAAPDLLAALKTALFCMESRVIAGYIPHEIAQVSAAIAKAEGR